MSSRFSISFRRNFPIDSITPVWQSKNPHHAEVMRIFYENFLLAAACIGRRYHLWAKVAEAAELEFRQSLLQLSDHRKDARPCTGKRRKRSAQFVRIHIEVAQLDHIDAGILQKLLPGRNLRHLVIETGK